MSSIVCSVIFVKIFIKENYISDISYPSSWTVVTTNYIYIQIKLIYIIFQSS